MQFFVHPVVQQLTIFQLTQRDPSAIAEFLAFTILAGIPGESGMSKTI